MSRKQKFALTAEMIGKSLGQGATSLTKIWHSLGGSGSVPGSIAKRMRNLVPAIESIMKANQTAQDQDKGEPRQAIIGNDGGVSKARKPPKSKPSNKSAKPKPKAKAAKWPHSPSNPFKRSGSAYGVCFDILAAHKDGLPRQKLVELLAKATGKDLTKAAFDVQVICSARGEAGAGLNPFEGPRNRSAHFGYWVKRDNSHVRLVLPANTADAKMETP